MWICPPVNKVPVTCIILFSYLYHPVYYLSVIHLFINELLDLTCRLVYYISLLAQFRMKCLAYRRSTPPLPMPRRLKRSGRGYCTGSSEWTPDDVCLSSGKESSLQGE